MTKHASEPNRQLCESVRTKEQLWNRIFYLPLYPILAYLQIIYFSSAPDRLWNAKWTTQGYLLVNTYAFLILPSVSNPRVTENTISFGMIKEQIGFSTSHHAQTLHCFQSHRKVEWIFIQHIRSYQVPWMMLQMVTTHNAFNCTDDGNGSGYWSNVWLVIRKKIISEKVMTPTSLRIYLTGCWKASKYKITVTLFGESACV